MNPLAQSRDSLQASDKLVWANEPGHAEEFPDSQHLCLHASITIDDPLHSSPVGLNILHFPAEVLVIVWVIQEVHEVIVKIRLNLLVVGPTGLIDSPVSPKVQSQGKVKLDVRVNVGTRICISYGLLLLNLGYHTVELFLEDHQHIVEPCLQVVHTVFAFDGHLALVAPALLFVEHFEPQV